LKTHQIGSKQENAFFCLTIARQVRSNSSHLGRRLFTNAISSHLLQNRRICRPFPSLQVISKKSISKSNFIRLAYIWFAAVLQRFPYYFAWYFSEGSCIMAGIGYSGFVNGKATWTRATNVKAVNLEMGQSFKDVTEAWNIRTDKWLKHCKK
jgi:hypothetical protein